MDDMVGRPTPAVNPQNGYGGRTDIVERFEKGYVYPKHGKGLGMKQNGWRWLGAGVAAFLLMAAAAAGQEDAPVAFSNALRHAVACPPFKGDSELAQIYHAEMVKMLKATDAIEYLEGSRASGREAPEFTYRINGEIVANEDGQFFVTLAVVDEARKEQIASYVAPASTEASHLAAWKKTIQADINRRASKLPFECRIRRQQGQESVSLDRGLSAGLQPGMLLYVSMDEEPLISPVTGEMIGRDSPRAAGQIQIFRVMEDTAYARPVLDVKLPRFSKLYARSF